MAIIFSNDEHELYGFPAFVANSADLMFKYSDVVVPIDSLSTEEGQRAIKLSEECLLNIKFENKICIVGGNRIINPDDYLFIPLLTSNEDEDLYQFNFLAFDKNNIAQWDRREEFIEVAKQFKKEGKWSDLTDFKFLDNLIDQMSGI